MILEIFRRKQELKQADPLQEAKKLFENMWVHGKMPHEEYQAYALAEGQAAAQEIHRFAEVPLDKLQPLCEELATTFAGELEENKEHQALDADAERVVYRHLPITKLLSLISATRTDVFSVRLRDLFPGMIDVFINDWDKIGFANRDDARTALARAGRIIRNMEPESIAAMLGERGLLARDENAASAAVVLSTVHASQEDNAVTTRAGKTGYIALVGAMLFYKLTEINIAAYEHVQNDQKAIPIERREDFLSLHDLMEKRYRDGAAQAATHDAALLGFMNAAYEIARGLNHVHERMMK